MRLPAFALAIFALVATLFAQGQKSRTLSDITVESYSVDQVEIRKALTDFFTSQKVHALISARVQGVVTAELRNLSAETVLQNVLRQVNATYRVENGVYEIVLKEMSSDSGDSALTAALSQYPERLTFNDDKNVYVLTDYTVDKYQKSDMKKVASGVLERTFPKETLDLSRAKDRAELQRLAKIADLDAYVDSQMVGTVSIPAEPASFVTIAMALTKSLSKNYYINGGVYTFFKPLSEYVQLQVVDFSPLPSVERSASVTSDADHLYLTVGRWLYKVRKSDMKTVGFSEIEAHH